jgi:ABC-type multidrug transport system fused ATPase/permease subunit
MASFSTGAIEAGFLVAVTRTALTITNGGSIVGLTKGVTTSISWALVIAGLLVLMRLLSSATAAGVSSSLNEQVGADLREELVSTYLASSWATQQNEPAGRLLQLVTGFVPKAVDAVNALTSTISISLNLAAMVTVSLFVDPFASLVIILALVLLASGLTPIRSGVKRRSREAAYAQREYADSVSELGQMGLEMQTFGTNVQFSDRIQQLSGELESTSRRANLLRGIMPQVFLTLAFTAIVFGLIVAASVGVSELTSVGSVMLVMLRSLTYGQQLQASSGMLAAAIPFLDELSATRDRYSHEPATRGVVEIDDLGTIAVSDVFFAYGANRHALVDVNFEIHPGEIIGIIGPSGSGKSTLVQLLLGLREPTSGTIEVGGTPLREINRRTWTEMTSFVPQDPNLFSGTVAENIRFFRTGFDEEDVVAAAHSANIASDIERLSEGYHTQIGERGTQLSGGQRQRIAIARALVGCPRLLVLDEPTSALDVHSDAMIRESISKLRGAVTVVVIAHRMSTLDVCDRLMVIEGGHIVAFDTPQLLRTNNNFYREALLLSGIEGTL